MSKCKIVVDERGKHLIVMPDGQHIPAVVWTRVWDGLPNEASYVIAKILIDIQPTETIESYINNNFGHFTREELVVMVSKRFNLRSEEASHEITIHTT